MELQRLGQRGVQGLHGWRAGGGGGGAESGQGRMGGVQALDEGSLSGTDVGHGTDKVGALLLQLTHGALQSGLAVARGVTARTGWRQRSGRPTKMGRESGPAVGGAQRRGASGGGGLLLGLPRLGAVGR